MLVKYPRTSHIPQSPGYTSDDNVLQLLDHFINQEVVISIKMDGENTSIYNNYFHARSLDSRNNESRDWVSRFSKEIGYMIPDNHRICGENLFAKHSIKYNNLRSYFYGFSIWNENKCLDWDSTIKMFDDIGITSVDTIYRGIFSIEILNNLIKDFDTNVNEGFVIRLVDSFKYRDFVTSVAKFVRKNHINTDKHWMYQKIIKNGLKK